VARFLAEHGPVPCHHRVQVVLRPPIRGGDDLAVHVDELIKRVPVRLGEETDQDRIVLRGGELAQAIRTGLPDVLGKGLLEVGVEPCQIQGQDLGCLDLIQFRDQPEERPWRGQTWRRLERVQGGVGRLLNLHESIEVSGHLGR
jgi:hypothetical protein